MLWYVILLWQLCPIYSMDELYWREAQKARIQYGMMRMVIYKEQPAFSFFDAQRAFLHDLNNARILTQSDKDELIELACIYGLFPNGNIEYLMHRFNDFGPTVFNFAPSKKSDLFISMSFEHS